MPLLERLQLTARETDGLQPAAVSGWLGLAATRYNATLTTLVQGIGYIAPLTYCNKCNTKHTHNYGSVHI